MLHNQHVELLVFAVSRGKSFRRFFRDAKTVSNVARNVLAPATLRKSRETEEKKESSAATFCPSCGIVFPSQMLKWSVIYAKISESNPCESCADYEAISSGKTQNVCSESSPALSGTFRRASCELFSDRKSSTAGKCGRKKLREGEVWKLRRIYMKLAFIG